MFIKNFKLKFEQNWPKPLLITKCSKSNEWIYRDKPSKVRRGDGNLKEWLSERTKDSQQETEHQYC